MFSSRFVRKYVCPRERGDIVPPFFKEMTKNRAGRGV